MLNASSVTKAISIDDSDDQVEALLGDNEHLVRDLNPKGREAEWLRGNVLSVETDLHTRLCYHAQRLW